MNENTDQQPAGIKLRREEREIVRHFLEALLVCLNTSRVLGWPEETRSADTLAMQMFGRNLSIVIPGLDADAVTNNVSSLLASHERPLLAFDKFYDDFCARLEITESGTYVIVNCSENAIALVWHSDRASADKHMQSIRATQPALDSWLIRVAMPVEDYGSFRPVARFVIQNLVALQACALDHYQGPAR